MGDGKDSVAGAAELVKTVAEALHLRENPETRGGPLQMAGRLFLSLTVILAATVSASAYLDTLKSEPAPTITALRWVLLGCILLGLIASIALVAFLVRKDPWLLFSPTELTAESQLHLLKAPITAGQAERKPENQNPAPQPGTPGA
jgi:hypothetical protein